MLERLEADKLSKLEACVTNHFDDISAAIAAAEAAILGRAGLQVNNANAPSLFVDHIRQLQPGE